MMGWGAFGWGGMLLMQLSMVLWVVVIGVLVWALVRWLGMQSSSSGPPPAGPAGPSALEILRQRYVRGEIDLTTFKQMYERLEGSRSPSSEPNNGS
jgi:putative membrane protein